MDPLIQILDNGIVRKTYHTSHRDTFEFMAAMCGHFIRNPDPLVVPIYAFQDLGSNKHHYRYSYDMMQCDELPQLESEIVDFVSDSIDRRESNPINSFYASAASETIDPQSVRKQNPKLFEFLEEVIMLDRYHDLHGGNVMLNKDGNYCLIDLEGFTYAPLNRSNNFWITKE